MASAETQTQLESARRACSISVEMLLLPVSGYLSRIGRGSEIRK
jgi:hypothetical protein